MGSGIKLLTQHSQIFRNSEMEDLLDSLPYFDLEYDDPKYKSEANRLIQEEMKRSKRKPSDFLSEFPPPPKYDFSNHPILSKEYERVRLGKPPVTIDASRYQVEPPPINKMNDTSAWQNSIQSARIQLQHQALKIENLELMLQYGGNSWRVYNQYLESSHNRLKNLITDYNRDIELLNRDRKLNQQAAASELSRLEDQWKQMVNKNLEIQLACHGLESEIELLRIQSANKVADSHDVP